MTNKTGHDASIEYDVGIRGVGSDILMLPACIQVKRDETPWSTELEIILGKLKVYDKIAMFQYLGHLKPLGCSCVAFSFE